MIIQTPQQYVTSFLVYNRCEYVADLTENITLERYIKKFDYTNIKEVLEILDQIRTKEINECVTRKGEE